MYWGDRKGRVSGQRVMVRRGERKGDLDHGRGEPEIDSKGGLGASQKGILRVNLHLSSKKEYGWSKEEERKFEKREVTSGGRGLFLVTAAPTRKGRGA